MSCHVLAAGIAKQCCLCILHTSVLSLQHSAISTAYSNKLQKTDLQADFHPIKLCALEKFGGFEGLEQALLLQVLRMPMMQSVEDIHLEELLVADPDLNWVVGRAVLIEPVVDQRNIHRPPCASRPARQNMI